MVSRQEDTKSFPYYVMRFVVLMLVGTLCMLFTEVFAGSAPLWFIDIWGILKVFPLYLVHLLFFLNVAVRTKRTSLHHLYLFGVLIALYESWITKVLWAGYPGQEGPLMGSFLGVALLEFSILVFFWHPIFAFVLPILAFEALAISSKKQTALEDKVLPGHLPLLKRNLKLLSFLTFAMFVGSAYLSNNGIVNHNVVIADVAGFGSVSLVFLVYKVASLNSRVFSTKSLQLKNRWLIVLATYLFLLYAVSFPLQQPEKIPTSAAPILFIMGFYGLVILLIKMSPSNKQITNGSSLSGKFISSKELFAFFMIFLLITTIFCMIPEASRIAAFILNCALFVGGPLFFAIMTLQIFKRK